jgi:hypothetical protein
MAMRKWLAGLSAVRTHGTQINTELLAFLVEVGAFEAEGTSGVGDVVILAAKLGEDGFAFEGFDAFGQRARRG